MRSRVGLLVGLAAVLCTTLPAYAHPADVELIPSGQYADVAVREIQRATTSIDLTMYLITLPTAPVGSAVGRLVDALAAAVGRGVAVRVVLDRASGGGWEGAKNQAAARALAARGIRVAFDEAGTRTHAKALVLDGTAVILGSSNWSEAALTRNVEANVLIRSPVIAQAWLREVAPEGPSPRHRSGTVPEDPTAVSVPWAWLNDRALLGRMATTHDEGAFDLFLHLLKTCGGELGGPQTIGYAPMARALGLQRRSDLAQRMEVRRVLYRLQRTYGFLTVMIRPQEDPVVTLTRPAAPAMALEDPVVRVPTGYLEWGWDRRLPLSAKILYLLGLHYAAVSPTAPVWYRSEKDLSAQHGFNPGFVGRGTLALRRWNLVEVQSGPLTPGHYGDRPANRYTPNPLYDPAGVAQQVKVLEGRYGAAAVTRARGYAAGVYEDQNAEAIERLLQVEGTHGPAVVRAAVRKVSAMSANNPKKTMDYLIGTIEGMGRRHANE